MYILTKPSDGPNVSPIEADVVKSEEDTVRRFLREIGLPESSTGGTRMEMLYYLRGRLGS